jgi:hypothetical protein
MKSVVLSLLLPLTILCQIPDEMGKEYILTNKIKSVTTSFEGKIYRIDTYDTSGKLIRSKHNRDNNFYILFSVSYDSLFNPTMDVTEYIKNDSVREKYSNKYKNVYENGKLIKWIFPAQQDTLFYTYDSSGLVKEKFVNHSFFDRIFGGPSLQLFPSFDSYVVEYSYSYDRRYHYHELSSKTFYSFKGKQQSVWYYYNELGDLSTVIEPRNANFLKHDYYYNEHSRIIRILTSDNDGDLREQKFVYNGRLLESFIKNSFANDQASQATFKYEFW